MKKMDVLTTKEVEREYSISNGTINKMVRQGLLQKRRFVSGGKNYYLRSDIEKVLRIPKVGRKVSR